MNFIVKRSFLPTAGGLLALTGLGKTFSALGPAKALDVPGPSIGLLFRHLILGVGLLELLIAFFCLFTDMRQDRSADLESAVSPVWNRQGWPLHPLAVEVAAFCRMQFGDTADSKSALRPSTLQQTVSSAA